MTVVVNCRFLTRPITGVERFATEMTEALARIRSDLVLIAPPEPALYRTELAGLPVQRVGTLSGHAWEQWTLPRHLRSLGQPVLLDLANTGPVRYRNHVVVIHDVTHRRHPGVHSRAFRVWYGVMTPHLVRRASAVVTVSDFSKREIYDVYGREDVAVTPNAAGAWVTGPQTIPAPVDALGGSPFFLTVGSRAPHKDLTTAYDAFRHYRDAGGEALLAVVGSSHRSLAADEGRVQDSVINLGRVSDEELAWLYGHARAFIFPTRYEGFGIPPVEAQAAGTAVIASDIPVLREVLADDSALRFPPGDAAALARAMTEVEDPRLAAQLVAAGRANAARYSWSASAAILSRLIDASSHG